VGGDLRERAVRSSLAEAEPAKRSKSCGLDARVGCRDGPAVVRAICVAEAETARRASLHGELSVMTRSMMGAAESHQVVELVPAALFARPNVMHIDENTVATSRHLAAMLVSTQYRSPRRGQSFNLAHAMALRAREPGVLCFGRRHARQLAHARPARGPVAKRLRELRQAVERFGNAQLVLLRIGSPDEPMTGELGFAQPNSRGLDSATRPKTRRTRADRQCFLKPQAGRVKQRFPHARSS
jgi:hypothetical protein